MGQLARLRRLDPTDFERVVADGLRRRGFDDVRHVGGPGDGGVDVRAVDAAGVVTLVQVKRYAERYPVGAAAVDALAGVVQTQQAGRGMFVTTSSFTGTARRAAELAGVELVDSATLLNLLR